MIRKLLLGSQLRRNIVSGSITAGLNVGIMLISYPLYLHYLGYTTYGLWLVLSTVLTFAQIGNLGISQALTKLVAEKHAKGDLRAIAEYSQSATALLLGTGGLIALGLTLFRSTVIAAFKLEGVSATQALWLLPMIAVLSAYVLLIQSVLGILSGLGRMDLTNYVNLAGRVVALIVSAVALFAGWGIGALLLANTLSWVLVHVACLYWIRKIVPLRILSFQAVNRLRLRELLGFGVTVVGGSLLNMLLGPFNKLMISRYIGLESVPLFEMAYQGSMQVRGIIAAGLGAFVPEISRLSAAGTQAAWGRIAQLNRRAIGFLAAIGGPLYLALLVLSTALFHWWLGPRYLEPLSAVFRIMLVGSFFSLLSVPAYHSLMGAGWVRACLGSHLVQSMANVVLVFFALRIEPHTFARYQLQAMAVSITISFALSAVYLAFRQRVLTHRATRTAAAV